MRFQLPTLQYELNALEPFISSRTMETHYGKHHKGYIDKTNMLLEAPTAWQEELTLEEVVRTSSGPLFNNAAQAWNHTFFWLCLRPANTAKENLPSADVIEAINETFGSFERFRQVFSLKAAEVFGSGWVWLVKDRRDRVEVVTSSNGDNPIVDGDVPLLTLDVWEHAYYLDYQNQRPKFIEGFWNLVNWDFVAENFRSNSIPNMTRHMVAIDKREPISTPRERPQPSL